MSLNNFQKVVLVFLLLGLLAFFSYYLLVHNFPATSIFSDKDVVKNWVVGGLLFFLVSFVLLFIFSGFSKATRDRVDLESPKQFVDVKDAVRIFTEEFVKDTRVPHLLVPNKDDDKHPFVKLARDAIVDIRKTRHFKDPKMQTSEAFWLFEVYSNQGDKRGIHTVLLRLDEGEEYIRNNWFENFEDNCIMENFKLRRDEYPITSAKAYADRISMKKLEMISEGNATADEIRAFDEISKNMVEENKKPVQVITKEDPENNYYENNDHKQSEVEKELSEIEQDIKKYQNKGN